MQSLCSCEGRRLYEHSKAETSKHAYFVVSLAKLITQMPLLPRQSAIAAQHMVEMEGSKGHSNILVRGVRCLNPGFCFAFRQSGAIGESERGSFATSTTTMEPLMRRRCLESILSSRRHDYVDLILAMNVCEPRPNLTGGDVSDTTPQPVAVILSSTQYQSSYAAACLHLSRHSHRRL